MRRSPILATMSDDLRPPLDGVLVINAGQILAAPFCATMLAEFGADVIKLERPGTGEPNHGTISYVQGQPFAAWSDLQFCRIRAGRSCSASSAPTPTS